MKKLTCSNCNNTVYFENVKCLQCEADLAFDPQTLSMAAIESIEDGHGLFRRIGDDSDALVQCCANAEHNACNWLTLEDDPNGLCQACDLNRIIPNLNEPGSLQAWQELERAKKQLVYSLLRFGLPLDASDLGKGRLTFDFVRDATTGHLDGVITIDVMEADAVERERQRQHFDEPYRTLLGHLRHESGHFYWGITVEAAGHLDEFRALFGDERQDYAAALARHHASGPAPDWQKRHVSAYASAHPLEDWAETWAHYLHMVETLDTAETAGMEPRAAEFRPGAIWPFEPSDIYQEETFEALMGRWIPLTIALNSLNRCMGHSDFYPFIIPAPAYDKLRFVHRMIRAGR